LLLQLFGKKNTAINEDLENAPGIITNLNLPSNRCLRFQPYLLFFFNYSELIIFEK